MTCGLVQDGTLPSANLEASSTSCIEDGARMYSGVSHVTAGLGACPLGQLPWMMLFRQYENPYQKF